MGQYWTPVNLDKKEFISAHRLASGLKLWEQIANYPSTGVALVILCAAMPETRGGGDFDLDRNWHGPERVNYTSSGPMPEDYPTIAHRTIGRWAGDRIALVGDYAEDDDLINCGAKGIARDNDPPFGLVYGLCYEGTNNYDKFTDVTEDVCAVIEHELNGKFSGDGWRSWEKE